MLSAVIKGDIAEVCSKVGNVFEQFIDVPDRVVIKAIMRKHGAVCACMSGSGPSVFGIFEEYTNAKNCLEELKKQFPESYLCQSTQLGCEI